MLIIVVLAELGQAHRRKPCALIAMRSHHGDTDEIPCWEAKGNIRPAVSEGTAQVPMFSFSRVLEDTTNGRQSPDQWTPRSWATIAVEENIPTAIQRATNFFLMCFLFCSGTAA